MIKIFSKKLITIESLLIILSLFFYNISSEFLINFLFISLLIMLFIFRSNSIRHMYFGFIFLLLSLVGDVLGFNKLVYLLSSLALSMFILGALNIFLSHPKE